MQIEQGKHCPMLDKDCIQFKCMFWMQLRGTHPQTGESVDEWDCAVKWLPVLLIEGAKETRQTGAAIESFRNEMVRGQQTVLHMTANGQVKEIARARDDR
jgi:hypothetical protein